MQTDKGYASVRNVDMNILGKRPGTKDSLTGMTNNELMFWYL